MRRHHAIFTAGLMALAMAVLFQNCGAPTAFDGSSADASTGVTRSSEGDVEFLAPQWAISDLPDNSTAAIAFAKANGVVELTSASPADQVTWEWQTRTPVTSGRSRVYNCPNTSLNSSVEFSWANGTTSGRMIGSSKDPNRAGCSQEVCFTSSTETACVTVRYTSSQIPTISPTPEPVPVSYLKANGVASSETETGSVVARADRPVRWSWKTRSSVLRAHSTVFGCKDPSRNGSSYFEWANQTTNGDRLGSSSDYRRDGCTHRVCMDTAEGAHCVTVEYTMPEDWGAMANGQAGVVYRKANEATTWVFKTDLPIERGTYEITQCQNPSFNSAKGEFTWANGKTEISTLGGSSDPGRVGCHQEVCVMNSKENYCVLVIYEAPGSSQ